MTHKKSAFENIVGKGENAGNHHFLLFPQCFLPKEKQIIILAILNFSYANVFNLVPPKNFLLGKKLTFTNDSAH